MLRKEFRLNSKDRKHPPSLSPGDYLQFITLWVPVRGFFSCATKSFVGHRPTRLRPKAERKTRMKSLWNPGYQFIYSTVEEVCSMSLSALTFTSPSRRPVKVLEGAGSDHCWLAHFVIMPRIMTVRSR